ncbi:unnamed protein product [Lampetra planeri]
MRLGSKTWLWRSAASGPGTRDQDSAATTSATQVDGDPSGGPARTDPSAGPARTPPPTQRLLARSASRTEPRSGGEVRATRPRAGPPWRRDLAQRRSGELRGAAWGRGEAAGGRRGRDALRFPRSVSTRRPPHGAPRGAKAPRQSPAPGLRAECPP